MPTTEIAVEIQQDFLERQAKATPVAAVAELIWNGLDADATLVDVDLEPDGLGGIGKVIVSDNGDGIPYEEAPNLFGKLGGSWKKHGAQTKRLQRMLHGQEGRGRFKALSLGAAVDWKVAYRASKGTFRYEISILESDIRRVRISEQRPYTGSPGVTVVVSDLKRNFTSLKPENSVQELSEIFAIYLKNYRDVQIRVAGEVIDPTTSIAASWEGALSPITDEVGVERALSLEIIEWRRHTNRALYLCNEQGFPLSQVEARFHVGDFHFSAYLKSSFVSVLEGDNRLDLAEMVPELARAVEEARDKIKAVFRSRAAERAKKVVDEWKARKLYPYEGESQNNVETAERQIFDIVAVTVQEATPNLGESSEQQLALHLRMLRHAIERSPTELQKILDEVLRLPKRKQNELAKLLDETSLSGIISAAGLVADRLKFLNGLNIILFDYETKGRLKERTQLHKILEQNTWIFGEEYNLWASDRSLTRVLQVHKEKLDSNIVIDEPVTIVSKTRGIVDLMLSCVQRRHRHDDIEHLVIELKAPKVRLTAEHMTQIEDYALAVEEDDRFKTVAGLKWHFWLISDGYNSQVEARIKNGPDPQRRLIQKGDRVQIGVKTWGEIIEENNARLQFIRERLEHRADDGRALAHLQEKHREFLEGVIVEDEADATMDLSEESESTEQAATPS
jgi:Histidine kinase-, DNA gyrase B-, and HSP90-like ATPase